MDTDTREVARYQKLVKLDGTSDRLDEDDNLNEYDQPHGLRQHQCANLIELQSVEQLIQLPVLADFVKFNVMLLETMESQLRLIVDENLQGLQADMSGSDMVKKTLLTFAMNFLHVTRISFANVALNIMTCLWCGVARKISCTSRRMSGCTTSKMVRCKSTHRQLERKNTGEE